MIDEVLMPRSKITKTPLDNLKDILSQADLLAEKNIPPVKETAQSVIPSVPHEEHPTEQPSKQWEENFINKKYSENIKKLDDILKAYRIKRDINDFK